MDDEIYERASELWGHLVWAVGIQNNFLMEQPKAMNDGDIEDWKKGNIKSLDWKTEMKLVFKPRES